MITQDLTDYLTCALWASTDDQGCPLDDTYSIDDFTAESLATAKQSIEQFYTLCTEAGINVTKLRALVNIGHDLFLTQNKHGVGFWDRKLPHNLGDKLTQISHKVGEIYVEISDDNKLTLVRT